MRKAEKLLAFALSLVLMLGALAITAFADDANVKYVGSAQKFFFSPGSEYSLTDLFPNFKDVMPGDKVGKKVTAENTGDADMFVRVILENKITPAEGIKAELNFDYITLDLNTTDWTEKDGAYYYNKTLLPGETTVPLFTTVSFSEALPDEYQGCTANIIVTLQAVQAKNNGESALTASGWPK